MRKWNGILTAVILLLFLVHGILGSFQLIGWTADAGKWIARAAAILVMVHAAIGVVLTVRTLRTQHRTGTAYFRNNLAFWAARISGLAVMVLLFFHFTAFGDYSGAAYRLREFNAFRLITQLLFVAALALHVLINVRPMLITFGFRGLRKWMGDFLFVLSVLLLFAAAALVVYFLRWQI